MKEISVVQRQRMAEIDPEGLTIKLEESMGDGLGLSSFADGSASAFVELSERRKLWDGDVGLLVYMESLRQAISEREDAEESDFQDDGDYILLFYAITITAKSRSGQNNSFTRT